MMEYLFGKTKTIKEVIDDHLKSVRRTVSCLEAEIARNERQERVYRTRALAYMRAGKDAQAMLVCKQQIRNERRLYRLNMAVFKMQALQEHLRSISVTQNYTQTLATTARIMQAVNASTNAETISRMLMRFNVENDKMEFLQETVDDAIGEIGEAEDTRAEETEEQELINANNGTGGGSSPASRLFQKYKDETLMKWTSLPNSPNSPVEAAPAVQLHASMTHGNNAGSSLSEDMRNARAGSVDDKLVARLQQLKK